jgi:CRP-like cAMP-binding protein
MIKGTRRLYPVGRVQAQIAKPLNRELKEQAGQSVQRVSAAPSLNPGALERLTQGYSSVPQSPRARASASPERQRMIQTAGFVSSMTVPFPGGMVGFRPSTASMSGQHKAFFAANQGKWYFAPLAPDPFVETVPVWAHLRSGTDAADCDFPSWVCRPTRALHGWLVFVDKNQAALAIQRYVRGWFVRLTSRRLQEEEHNFALLAQATKKEEAARQIQAQFRAHAQRVVFLTMKTSAVWIQAMVRGWLSRNSDQHRMTTIAGAVQAEAAANLRSKYTELGDEATLDVAALSQLLTEIGLSAHIVTNAQRLLATGLETSAAYSYYDACALLAAVNARSSQGDVLSEQESARQATAIREALRTSCILTEHELGDASGGKEVEEEELTRLLQLLSKPAELRSDKDLELLDRRWACGYSWFQELSSHMRREMCRYLRGGLLAATEPIYLVGEPLTAVFFVARGRVQLHPGGSEVPGHNGHNGHHRPARTVGPGEAFGLPSAAKDADSVDWLRHERRVEVAEAEKGTVLLALGIEQWAWAHAERAACERAMISRLLRSTALFANISLEAHAALAAAMQCNAMRFKEGEAIVKQGDKRADRLCLLTSGEVKMTVAVRDQVLHRGGGGQPAVGTVAKETKIDVGIFNARGEVTGETTLLDPHDPENKWKAEASLVACVMRVQLLISLYSNSIGGEILKARLLSHPLNSVLSPVALPNCSYRGPVRGFAINADELSRLLIGYCHQALSDLSVAAHHLATERKIMIWQRLRECHQNVYNDVPQRAVE